MYNKPIPCNNYISGFNSVVWMRCINMICHTITVLLDTSLPYMVIHIQSTPPEGKIADQWLYLGVL